jgi:uncharacterized protein (UPF0333 family)
MKSNAQVSIEYMLIIGFATIMTIPILIIYYSYTSDSSEAIAASQALQIARNVVDSSDSVYYLGKPSQTTLKLNFPNNIDSINLSNREVVFNMKTRNGIGEVIQLSSVNLSGSLPTSPGIHTVTLKAQDGYVEISSN